MMSTSKRRLSAFVVVVGLLVIPLALNARAQTPAPIDGCLVARSASQHQPAVVPVAGGVRALQLQPIARLPHGEVRRLARTDANTVDLVRSRKGAYPSGYNMSYLNAKDAFIQGGSYGDVKGSIGPFVAKVDPKTLKPVWYTQLVNTKQTGEWDYPGAMAIENNGFIYVVSGYRIFKVDPANGKVVKTLKLPTQVYMRNNYPTRRPLMTRP